MTCSADWTVKIWERGTKTTTEKNVSGDMTAKYVI